MRPTKLVQCECCLMTETGEVKVRRYTIAVSSATTTGVHNADLCDLCVRFLKSISVNVSRAS